ncbi:hypothetical protein PMAYCL1PPCAC_33428, partial [Pristionchus mayeri]
VRSRNRRTLRNTAAAAEVHDLRVRPVSCFVFHPLVTYLLLFRSKGMNEDMRRGFFLLRISQILLDVLFGLLFQPYPLTPLPVLGGMGLLCDAGWLPPVHMFGILGILINGTVVIYLSLLLHIQQTLIVGESRTRISSRLQYVSISPSSRWHHAHLLW